MVKKYAQGGMRRGCRAVEGAVGGMSAQEAWTLTHAHQKICELI